MRILVNGNIKHKAPRLVIASAVLGLILGGIGTSAEAQDAAASAPVEGSWIFSVTGLASPFTALASFGAGGVWSATGSLDRVPPANSTLFGSWKHVAGNRFNLTAYFFNFVDSNSPATSMMKTNELFRLTSRDELVGVGDLRACDVNGQNCGASLGNISITATRIIPENGSGLTLP